MKKPQNNLGKEAIISIIAFTLAVWLAILFFWGVFTGQLIQENVSFKENTFLFIGTLFNFFMAIFSFLFVAIENYQKIKKHKNKENIFLAAIIYIVTLILKLGLAIIMVFALFLLVRLLYLMIA